MTSPEPTTPVFVTFETGARLLVERGILPHATGDTIRYIARTRDDWPYGDDTSNKPHKYIPIGNARTMETGVFLDYFRKHPPAPGVRGPGKRPRRPKGRS
ncbi:hypothetical protein [Streptomyces sp. NPDC060243]|uniref:hypothetical protein n=1 Tax=Streptomyces sp. NPDC060243 TaxID=3347081 RepID=UPI003650929B